jgi:saccharopine dehydrogenase-like NADP-dependent oxidoreductase
MHALLVGTGMQGRAALHHLANSPGITTITAADRNVDAARRCDRVTEVLCYPAGVPEPAAATNPLKYEISRTFEGVLPCLRLLGIDPSGVRWAGRFAMRYPGHSAFWKTMVDRRDLTTGLSAMRRLVGFTASIGAQMIVRGDIRGGGLESPVVDVPFAPFGRALADCGITITTRESAETA